MSSIANTSSIDPSIGDNSTSGTPAADPISMDTPSNGGLIGGIIGGIIILLALVVILIMLSRKQRNQSTPEQPKADLAAAQSNAYDCVVDDNDQKPAYDSSFLKSGTGAIELAGKIPPTSQYGEIKLTQKGPIQTQYESGLLAP
jgi:predicted lipid-binding transport protein (Tim44 family)